MVLRGATHDLGLAKSHKLASIQQPRSRNIKRSSPYRRSIIATVLPFFVKTFFSSCIAHGVSGAKAKDGKSRGGAGRILLFYVDTVIPQATLNLHKVILRRGVVGEHQIERACLFLSLALWVY